ncbi:hypothetical protein PsorP6_018149 [Peronosclerospora sorghi]|uniref:Uncharacterized protein n=1 Tax=Peronosclerospora sorghi TaxID=230839 RepID=A0ACC0WE12_9STRA|nr:hypothetical protein PsorP6_018149 [Peronosclerospora sorghi]
MSDARVDMDAELAQLLREQERFLHEKKQPSAKIIHRGDPSNVPDGNIVENVRKDHPRGLKSVIERQVTPVGQAKLEFPSKSCGFPAVQKRGPGQSLFGRQRREAASKKQEESLNDEESAINASNRARLEEMSPQEIREAQEELKRMLDPKLIEKFKNRRRKVDQNETEKAVDDTTNVRGGTSGLESIKMEGKEQFEKAEVIQRLAAVKTEEELNEQVNLLPLEERAKLDWTRSSIGKRSKNRDVSSKLARPTALDATLERFDLDGKVLEATAAELPMHSGLFHHGDEPHAAGYTLPELLHLARSSVASQRAMALHVVSKILHNRQLDASASLSVVPRVLPRDMAITLRIVLDDQNRTALSAGVSALHAFIVPIAIDSVLESHFVAELKHGTVLFPPEVHLHRDGRNRSNDLHARETEEVVYIDTAEADDGSRISDEDLAALDPMQALLNMDLTTRLRYILETIQLPDQQVTEKILEIFIAVARYSPRAAHEVTSNTRLIKLLQQKYIENEHILSFQEDNTPSLRFCLRALQLVRALCQGQRGIASVLMTNGLIQSTKGFLALNNISSGKEASALFVTIQVESLRIWRVILGYGLDFHSFGYLFPLLCGLLQKPLDASIALKSALFAALEAFCGLGAVHEAQHYFNQIGFYLTEATDEAMRLLRSLSTLNDDKTAVFLATVLRFLTAASAHVIKYNLDRGGHLKVFKLIQSRDATRNFLAQLNDTVAKRELLVAIVCFHRQVVTNGLISDDLDDDEVIHTFSRQVNGLLLAAMTSALSSASSKFSLSLLQACELAFLLGQQIGDVTTEFVQSMYRQVLILVERLGSGGEYLVARLFAEVVFHPRVLLLLNVFHEEAEARRMSHLLIPIYQALVHTAHTHETHSALIFTTASTGDKVSHHLRLPPDERTYIPSNLPLPKFWIVCPLSRMEYGSTGNGTADPTRSQSDEMKLIVSATCRFLFELERLAPQIASMVELRPEDQLFHLLHVFFAGSDVLFDDHVDAALGQVLPKLVHPLLHSPVDSRVFYEGIVRNLKCIQSFESGEELHPSLNQPAPCFTSEEQLVLTFVEKLVSEFTATSFGNPHFAHCMTLFMTCDLPLELRKFVWKELQDAHLLHTLAPFEGLSSQLFQRCTLPNTRHADAHLLQWMQQAVCTNHISPSKGAFAYSLAIHFLVAYLFPEGEKGTLNAVRQQLAQTLGAQASPGIWRHLLSYYVSKNSALLTASEQGPILSTRVDTLRTQAAWTSDQVFAFETTVALLENAANT